MIRNARMFVAWVASCFKRGNGRQDRHVYEFAVGQTLFVASDLGRSGVVRGRRFDSLTDTEEYLVERSATGAKEWYPRMSLCRHRDEAGQQPTQRDIPLSADEAAQFAARRPQ